MRATRAKLRQGHAAAYVPYDVRGLHAKFGAPASPSRGGKACDFGLLKPVT